MTEDGNLSEECANRWYALFRSSGVVERLFEVGDVDVSFTDLRRDGVVDEGNGEVTVSYHHEGSGCYVRLDGVFEADSTELRWAELEDGRASTPLAGHGTIWRYEDGNVSETRWMS